MAEVAHAFASGPGFSSALLYDETSLVLNGFVVTLMPETSVTFVIVHPTLGRREILVTTSQTIAMPGSPIRYKNETSRLGLAVKSYPAGLEIGTR